MKSIAVLVTLLVCPALSQTTASRSTAVAPFTPAEVVNKYCQADFGGARQSSKTYQKMDHLHLFAVEPGWDSSVVVRDFKVMSSKTEHDKAWVTVRYENLGEIDGGTFLQDSKPEVVKYELERSNKEWSWSKTDEPVLTKAALAWRIKAPLLKPHVGLEQTIRHLRTIASLPATTSDAKEWDAQLDKAIHELEKLRSHSNR